MNKIIQSAALVLVFVSFSACDLQKTNISPNSPTEVPTSVLLPFSQEGIARLQIGTTQVMSGIFMKYYEGVDNHPIQVQRYILNEALYVDWNWNDYYDGPMINLKIMIDLAEQEKSYYYSGIGKVLMANCLGNVSSLWGDVPFNEALAGSLNKHPAYDPQKNVYEKIQQLLDDGIKDLETEYVGSKPSTDDLIYGGDITKWIKAAYALKARYYLHLTKRTNDLTFNPAEKALDAASNAFTSSDDDMQFSYGYSATEYNPFYSFTLLNYILPNSYFTNLMLQLSDPRKDFLYKKKFGVATLNGLYFTSTNSPSLYITYHEVKFIEAEARLRMNASDPEIQNALHAAITASILKLSSGTTPPETIDTYLTNNATLSGDFESVISKIIQQKYIALFASIESWTDYRRTGYPVLTPNIDGDHNQNPGGNIPRRLAYPQTERLYNQNFPVNLPTLQDRFWWDQ